MIDWMLVKSVFVANVMTVILVWIALRLPYWAWWWKLRYFLGLAKPVYGTLDPGISPPLNPDFKPSKKDLGLADQPPPADHQRETPYDSREPRHRREMDT